jgi:hypothetical protein
MKSLPTGPTHRLAARLSVALGAIARSAENPGKKSEFHASERHDFRYNDRDCIIVAARSAAQGNPWIWLPVVNQPC